MKMFTWQSIKTHLNVIDGISKVEILWVSQEIIANQERQRKRLSELVRKFKRGKSIILKAARVS